MKFVVNTLLLAGFVALCYAACDVCNCNTSPPLLTEAQFMDRIKTDTSVENRTFVPASNPTITDCLVSLDCTFDEDFDENRMIFMTASDYSFSTNLNEMTCNDASKWIGNGEEVIAVGCFGLNYLF